MRFLLPLLAGLAVPIAPAAAEPVAVQRFGLYVVSDDLPRARAFYTALFGAPQVVTPGMIGFDVAGGLYAIVARAAYARDAKHGDTTRPYVKVRDIAAAFAQVKALAPARLESAAVIGEGAFRYFRFRDPDGNLIEFFSVG